jgi:sulfate transport system permease protein
MSAADRPRGDASRAGRLLLIGAGMLLTGLVIAVPLAAIFAAALAKGIGVFADNIRQPDTVRAILLTCLTAVLVVPVNLGFGLAAAWAVTRFRFPGRKLLIALVDLPISISPVVAGVAYILLYGGQGLLGPFLKAHDLQIAFALPGIVLVTMFVTAPYVARELIPLMQAQGSDAEEAALTLGASGWQTFRRVTLPGIKWALFYGVVLCTARAIGEFGAVSVISGNVRGETNTLPLQVEQLYHDYNAAGAFAAASILALIALVTIAIQSLLERQHGRGSAGH